jgi:hypothetical protein
VKVHVGLGGRGGKVHGGRCWRLVAKYRCGPGLAVWIAPLGNVDGRALAENGLLERVDCRSTDWQRAWCAVAASERRAVAARRRRKGSQERVVC